MENIKEKIQSLLNTLTTQEKMEVLALLLSLQQSPPDEADRLGKDSEPEQ